uniref:Uncharacterized protein n=1 Tax=Glossina pallidipes TaxID=7398 RepID=A0A1A9Z381_GLOPL
MAFCLYKCNTRLISIDKKVNRIRSLLSAPFYKKDFGDPKVLNDRFRLRVILIIESSFNPSIYCQEITRITRIPRIKSYVNVKMKPFFIFSNTQDPNYISKNITRTNGRISLEKSKKGLMTQTDIYNLMQILGLSFKKVTKPSLKTATIHKIPKQLKTYCALDIHLEFLCLSTI